MEVGQLTIDSARALLEQRQTTATALAEAFYQKIEAEDREVHAYLTLCRERALEQAARMDALIEKRAPLPPLAGVPIAVKDVLVTRGIRTTAGSKMLEDFVPPYTGTAVERLEAAGAVVLGKLNCDEFAMGSSNENSAFGPVLNPRDKTRVPGGSSGGSAAAVAAGTAVATLGTDTGGSIRQPAAFCGIVGAQGTYGRVSRYGLIAYASSLDRIGPMAKSVKDAAMLLAIMAGRDPEDPTSADLPVPDYTAALGQPLAGLRVGMPEEYFARAAAADVCREVEAAIEQLARLGCEIVRISLPHTHYAIPTYFVLSTAEASSNLARYDGVRYGFRAAGARTLSEMYRLTRDRGFGAEVKRRIMLGTFVLSAGYYDAYYGKAQRVRALITRDFDQAFEKVDVIATPTTPTAAFRFGEKANNPVAMYLADVFTVPASLAGLPAISLPCGRADDGLPVGLQLIARHFDESTMFRAAHAYEHVRGPVFAAPGK
jgi:aspartyl-tRNA(Asn)/glutamyl-tRNA(Gln) amidotransferase subunit A